MENDKIVTVTYEDGDSKSSQVIEQELVAKDAAAKAAAEVEGATTTTTTLPPPASDEPAADVVIDKDKPVIETPLSELNDEDVLSHIRKKTGKADWDYSQLDAKPVEVEKIVEVKQELSPEMSAYEKFKAETGRGLGDFMKVNKDFSKESDDAILAEYTSLQNPDFDAKDVDFDLRQQFGYNEDDEEVEKRTKEIAKKRKLGEAKKFLSDYQEKYKAPLESSDGLISAEKREKFANFEANEQRAIDDQAAAVQRAGIFSEKTEGFFANKFEGFEFKVGEGNAMFKVNDADSVKKTQSDARNFINRHLDEKGILKDPAQYHKEMFAATNADKIASWAYEMGKADAVKADAVATKNIDMPTKKAPVHAATKNGTTVTYESTPGQGGGGLKVGNKYT